MGNLARKIIDAVQNAMLDRLVVRLSPLWAVLSLWEGRRGDQSPDLIGALLLILLVLLALGWALGAMANRRPRPPGRALERLQKAPSNGFEAWTEPPADGLRPPTLLRWLVMTLGSRRSRASWTLLISVASFLSAFGLLIALAHAPEAFWANLHPVLSDLSVRDALWIGATAILVLQMLRQWADEQRDRLEPGEVLHGQPRSDWVPLGAIFMITVAVSVFASFTFRWPISIMAVPILPLAVIACVPAWRGALVDVWFGKPVDDDVRQSDRLSRN